MKGQLLLLLLLLLFLLPQHPFSIRHHILNGTYVIRGRDGSSSSEKISGGSDGARRLQQLLADVFHITAPDSPLLCKYLDA